MTSDAFNRLDNVQAQLLSEVQPRGMHCWSPAGTLKAKVLPGMA
jgi:hypothetical protein